MPDQTKVSREEADRMHKAYREALIALTLAPRRIANALPMPDHDALGWVSRAYDPVPVLARVVWAEHPTEPIEDPDDPAAGVWIQTLAWGWSRDGQVILVAVQDIWETSRQHMTYLHPADVQRRTLDDPDRDPDVDELAAG